MLGAPEFADQACACLQRCTAGSAAFRPEHFGIRRSGVSATPVYLAPFSGRVNEGRLGLIRNLEETYRSVRHHGRSGLRAVAINRSPAAL